MSCPFDDFFGDAKGPFDASYEQGKRDEEIVKDYIESLGLQVRWATDGEDRLGKCDFFGEQPQAKNGLALTLKALNLAEQLSSIKALQGILAGFTVKRGRLPFERLNLNLPG